MTDSVTRPAAEGPRRLWIPVLLVAAQVLCVTLPRLVEFENMNLMFSLIFMGPMVASAGIVLWWLFLSRLRWADRLLGLVVVLGVAVAGFFLADPSFRLAL